MYVEKEIEIQKTNLFYQVYDFYLKIQEKFKKICMLVFRIKNFTKSINVKRGPSSVQTASPTKELKSVRVPSSIAVA